MGVTHLWPILKETGSLTELRADKGQHAQIAAHVDGLTVAVDLSTWVMEAQHQLNLKEVFHNDRAQCLKMVFERSLNWLRYGVLPVFVVEGVPPEAKRQLMAKRQALRQGTAPPAPSTQRPSASQQAYRPYTTQFEQMNRHVTDLLDAMGLPWVQACGEAEATCAALSRAGLVDGVQSKDVDTMLFGAEVVYKVLHLQAEVCRLSHLERCTMEGVRSALGLTSLAGTAGGGANDGGSAAISGCRALIAMAQLAGGDYNKAGATNVGPTIALGSVRTLLKRAGARSDENVLELLKQALDAGPDQHLLSLVHCTGCKTCGHESGNKSSCKQHGRAGCAGCGTTSGCEPRTFERCGCEFHQREDERWLAKVVARAVGTEHFTRMCEGAAEVYLQQAADAAAAVARLRPRVQQQGGFRWSHRPDAAKLVPLLCPHLDWKPRTLVGKLMPLLVEWDLRQGPQAPFPGGGPGASDVQFCAVAIQKVAGKQPAAKQMATQQQGTQGMQGTQGSDGEGEEEAGGAGGEGTVGWRYVLRLETVGSCLQPGRKLPGRCAAAAPGRGGSGGGGVGPSGLRGAAAMADGAGPSQRGAGATQGKEGEEEEEEEQEVDLNEEARKWLEGCKSSLRSVRRNLVDAVWPHLEQEKKGGAAAGAGNGAKATKKGKAKATGMEGQEGALLRFLKPKRAAVEGEQGAQAGKGKALVEDQGRKGDVGNEGEGEEAGPSQSQAQRGRTQEAGPSQNQAQRGRMQEAAAGPSAAAPCGGAPPARARTAVAAPAAVSGGGGGGGGGGGPMDRYLASAKAGPSGSGGAGGAASEGGSERSASAGLSHLIALNKEVLERRAALAEEEAREREAKRAEAAAARERAEAAAAAAGSQPAMQRSQQRRARGALARAVEAIEILDSGDEEEEKEAPRGSGVAEGRARQQRETGRAQGRAVQAAAAAIEILSSDDDGDGGRDGAGVRQGGGPATAPGSRPSAAAAGASGSGTEGCNGGSGGGGLSPRPGSGETPMTMAGVAAALSPYKRRLSAAEQAEEEAGAGGVSGGPGSGGNLAPRGAVDVGGAGGSGCRDGDRDRESLALPAGGEVCQQGGEQQPPAGVAAGSPAKRPRQQQVPRAGQQQQQQQQQRPQPCRVGDAGAGGAGHRQGGEEGVIDLTD